MSWDAIHWDREDLVGELDSLREKITKIIPKLLKTHN